MSSVPASLMKRHILRYLSVGVGGMIGATLRYAIALWIGNNSMLFPWETLTVNITGACVLSFLLFVPLTKEKISPLILPGITTGILGAYTTFSTLALEVVQLLENHAFLAMVYLGISFLGGLISSFIGYKLARSLPTHGGAPS